MLLELSSDYLNGYWTIVESLSGTKYTYRVLKMLDEIDISNGKKVVTYITDKVVPMSRKYLDYEAIVLYDAALKAMREYAGYDS